MKSIKTIGLLAGVLALTATTATLGSPESDREAFVNYFSKRFADVKVEDYKDGVYAFDAAARAQWQEIEDFAPYEIYIEEGEKLFSKPFANGKTYASCFENGGVGIRQNYPYWDAPSKAVRTLEQDINACRTKNDEQPLKWAKGKIASISAYMSYTSRGKISNVVIPEDADALAAYEDGKKFYYSKRGQLNMSCATCHVQGAQLQLRADVTSPALGQTTHFPVYRSKWGALGTLHRRFNGCNKQVRAKPFKPQGSEYRNLEFFLAYMNNGQVLNGPGSRK